MLYEVITTIPLTIIKAKNTFIRRIICRFVLAKPSSLFIYFENIKPPERTRNKTLSGNIFLALFEIVSFTFA